MLTSGEVVRVDLGTPVGREAGFSRPAVVVTAQRLLDATPSVVHVVPLTSALRGFGSEVTVVPDARNRLERESSAQCQHLRSVSVGRLAQEGGDVGAAVLAQVRDVVALVLDLPA